MEVSREIHPMVIPSMEAPGQGSRQAPGPTLMGPGSSPNQDCSAINRPQISLRRVSWFRNVIFLAKSTSIHNQGIFQPCLMTPEGIFWGMGSWLVVEPTPLKNISSSVGISWDDEIPN